MCVTIKRACFRWCGMIQYSALVNSVFNNKFNTFFGLNLTLVYTFPMCMTWRFHFPIRNYDFKRAVGCMSVRISVRIGVRCSGGVDRSAMRRFARPSVRFIQFPSSSSSSSSDTVQGSV